MSGEAKDKNEYLMVTVVSISCVFLGGDVYPGSNFCSIIFSK